MKLLVDIDDMMYDWLLKGFPDEKDYLRATKTLLEGVKIDFVFCIDCEYRKKNRFCLEHMKYEHDDCGFCSHGKRMDDRETNTEDHR